MKDIFALPQTELRPPEEVMRLARLGQSFPTRLSFLRVLMRNLKKTRARVIRTLWDMDSSGFGRAVYTLKAEGECLSLVAFSQALADADRSDRVIATAWDAAFVLYDGVPSAVELDRLAANVPLQEQGRFDPRDLVLSRANKSLRVWQHLTSCLRAGQEPDTEMLRRVGYLMRTTAVYGNGKFGLADRYMYEDRTLLSGPFAAEMLCVWLIRQFTLDLVEHVGRAKLPTPVKRSLGVGNATGLGMAPFLVSHPVLLNNWIMVRETALARARAAGTFTPAEKSRLRQLYETAALHVAHWEVPDAQAATEIATLRRDWQGLAEAVANADIPEDVFQAACSFGVAAQELSVSLLIELYPDKVDGLAECMTDPFGPPLAPLPTTDTLREAIARDWQWAMQVYEGAATARFWYISANKLEPRLGARDAEPGAENERALDVARAVARLARDLPEACMGTEAFIARYPEHAFAVKRITTLAAHPYSEIRDNLIASDLRPIDMLRAKLAFFGATGFDPKSDLWTRITLAQGMPTVDEIATHDPPWLPEPLQ